MQVSKIVLAQYSARQMFDLIEAAEHYPSFLPWCSGATILERDDSVVVADVSVNYHGVRFQFRTRNPKRAPEWMALRLEHGPFRHFEGEWNLKPLGPEGCRIEFELRYDFKSTLMTRLAGPVFDRITNTLVDAFVNRADSVYQPGAVAPLPPLRVVVSAAASAADPVPDTLPPSAAPLPTPAPMTDPAASGGDPNRSETP